MNSILQSVFDWIKASCLEPSLMLLKLRAAIYYLEGVKTARRILLLLCLLVFLIILIGAGLVILPLALLIFMPWEPSTKAIVGSLIGAIYLLVPLAALATLLSERRWMKLTGASDILRKLAD